MASALYAANSARDLLNQITSKFEPLQALDQKLRALSHIVANASCGAVESYKVMPLRLVLPVSLAVHSEVAGGE
jgi:hypothetical protein